MYLTRIIRENLAVTLATLCALIVVFIFTISQLTTHRHRSFEQILASGELRVLYVQQPFNDEDVSSTAHRGEEYQKLCAFAKQHDLQIKFIPLNHFSQLTEALCAPYADMAYDNISMTRERKNKFIFTNKVMEQTLCVVAHKWNANCDFTIPTPKKITLESGTSYFEHVESIKHRYPELIIDEKNENTEYIVDLIANGELQMTICEKNYFDQYVDGKKPLKSVMELQHKDPISWLLPPTSLELKEALNSFLRSEKLKKMDDK